MPDRGTPLRLADRLIRLQGTVNFRDAGGYRTRDGQWVRMGEVYRSDALDRLTGADLAKLARLGVRTVLDLRMESERAAAPDRVPAGATHVVADVLAGSGTFTALPKTPAETEAMMVEGNRFMVAGATAKAAYTTVLDEIGDGEAVLSHLPPAQAAVYKPLLDVRPAYLNASFDEVREEFGSFRSYLKQGLGLDAHELKALRRDLLVG